MTTEQYMAQRGRRFAAWVAANIGGFIVWYKTDSLLWLLVWSIALGYIRYAPLLCQLDQFEREAKQREEVGGDVPDPDWLRRAIK